jgi:membrane fusion protein, multidrug efflux system
MANEELATPELPDNSARTKRIKTAALIVLIIVIAGFSYWWFFSRNFVSTDDAYARADSAQLSSRIPGTILQLHVDNDYFVTTGQTLIELDPADYGVAVDRAKAALDQDEADLRAAEITVPPVDIQTSSQVLAAEASLKAAQDTEQQTRHTIDQLKNTRAATAADLSQAERDNKRFENLFTSGAGTERQHEQTRTTYERTKAQLNAIDAQIAALESGLSASAQQVSRARAQLQSTRSERSNVEIQHQKVESLKAKRDRSKAELEAAKLNLSYCTIMAPIPGYIAQKSIQIGDRIQPGQALMAVVPLQNIYVEANFKETQLTNVRLGQPVSISADIYPGYEYNGKVVGIRAGTGAAFSLIPPENATGNWIKVVQRIPVKIELDKAPPADHPLRVGTSLDVTINIADRSGLQLIADGLTPVSLPSSNKP